MNWRNFSRALLGVAGAGLLLFPAGLSHAQTATTPAAKDEKKIERKDKKATPEEREAEIRAAREDVERIQKEMEKLQEQMQKRGEDMQKAMQRLHQLEGGRGGGFNPGRFGPGGGPGGFPGGGAPGWGGPPQGGNTDQRLQQVEQKLDMILKELRDLRGEKKEAPKGGKKGATPAGNPGATPTPNAPGISIDSNQPAPTPPRAPISDPSRP